MACAACGPKPVRIAPPPADLTRCADEPPAPDLPPPGDQAERQTERDTTVLAYILALRSAWGDCRAKVDGIRAWSAGVK